MIVGDIGRIDPKASCSLAFTFNFKLVHAMKKFVLFPLFAVLMQVVASAQILDKGNFMIGTTIGFSTANSKVSAGGNEEKGLSPRQINIAPSIGYFVLDNFALGIGADYTINRVVLPNDDKKEDSDLLFGPFARYYFLLGDNAALFAVANFGFGNSKDEQTVGETTESISTNIFAVGVGPGITVYSKGGFGIEAIFKYNYANSKFDTKTGGVTTSTTTKTNQFALSMGLQYYFGGLRRVRN